MTTSTTTDRASASRVLHGVDQVTSLPATALVLCIGVVITVTLLIVTDFPTFWTNLFWTLSAGTTVVMAFVIQHTQSRLQLATQLKLDELIRTAPRADDRLVHIETGTDTELLDHEQRLVDHREATLGPLVESTT
jgi:low affinity Fe/Cu permease